MGLGTGVPLAGELVAVLSVGATVGLAVYLGWVDTDRSAGTKAAGFAGALGGALVGGWLGFGATGDALAILTAIVGAVAGANLVLVLLDVARERSVRDRSPEPRAAETLDAHPSTS